MLSPVVFWTDDLPCVCVFLIYERQKQQQKTFFYMNINMYFIYFSAKNLFFSSLQCTETTFTWTRAIKMKNPNSLNDPIFDSVTLWFPLALYKLLQYKGWSGFFWGSKVTPSTWQPIRNQGHHSWGCPGVCSISWEEAQRVSRKERNLERVY